MTYSAKAIANLLIDIGREKGCPVDQMKLQKLVYVTHGWNLAITGNPLISDDVQAWQYGPVIPILYSEFRSCGRNAITDHATDIKIAEEDLSFSFETPRVDEDDCHTRELAQKIWAKYGAYTGPQLSNLTHMPDTPWDKVYKASPRGIISNELIAEHFTRLSHSQNVR